MARGSSFLPKSLTTVTPFSKFLAMALFVILPFVGFFLGLKYKRLISTNLVAAVPIVLVAKQDNLTFTVKPCDKKVNAWDNKQMGIKKVVWNDTQTLSVKANVSVLCGGEEISEPDYKINDKNLVLGYTVVRDTMVAKCVCAKELNYVISNLPKKNYDITLSRK